MDLQKLLERLKAQGVVYEPDENVCHVPTHDEMCVSTQQSSRVPTAYVGALLEHFAADDFDARCAPGWLWSRPLGGSRSVFVSGPNGAGKTHLAAALVGEWGGRWRTALDIMLQVQATWRRGADETEIMVTSDYRKCALLVVDDITAIAKTERGLSVILGIISGRCDYERPTIVTSFQGLKAIDAFDSSLASRLSGFTQLRLVGRDRRRDCGNAAER